MVADDLARRLRGELPTWRLDGESIVGVWRFPDFAAALAAAVRVGALAERADHHPDLSLSWGRLEARLTTHRVGSLTDKDLALASAIQQALGRPSGS